MIRQSVPDARFLIVGRNPNNKVLQLNPSRRGSHGFVTDVRPYFDRASVAVAPFRIAAGIQNKILEALACGLPVVATACAAKGLEPEVAQSIRVADSPQAIAAEIVSLFADPPQARREGLEGRRLVSLYYSWRRSSEQLLALLENPSTPSRPMPAERLTAPNGS